MFSSPVSKTQSLLIGLFFGVVASLLIVAIMAKSVLEAAVTEADNRAARAIALQMAEMRPRVTDCKFGREIAVCEYVEHGLIKRKVLNLPKD